MFNPLTEMLKIKLLFIQEALKGFQKDNRGGIGGAISAIIGLSIAALIIATIFLEGLLTLASADTTNLTGTTLVLFGLISVFLALGVILLILKAVGISIK